MKSTLQHATGLVSRSRALASDNTLARTLLLAVLFGMLEATAAQAQFCEPGYPVDCGTYCCESGGVCYNGGCNAPAETSSCEPGYPVDCGTYCCPSGGVCYDGGCNGPPEGTGTCEPGYPVDCGTYCCESGNYCENGGCSGGASQPQPTTSSCADEYPVDCGTFCCASGTSCGAEETCLAGSSDGSTPLEICPYDYPIDCGGSFCCPSGTTCAVDGCLESGGVTTSGSDVICASNAISTDFGSCTLDFCIANTATDCEGYYLVNGGRISCNACAADADCAQRAADACTGSGVSSGGSSNVNPGGGCCGPSDTCDWAYDGVCNCSGAYGWDSYDCAEEEEDPICSITHVGSSGGRNSSLLVLTLLSLVLVQRRRRLR